MANHPQSAAFLRTRRYPALTDELLSRYNDERRSGGDLYAAKAIINDVDLDKLGIDSDNLTEDETAGHLVAVIEEALLYDYDLRYMPKEQFDPLYHAQWEDYRNERETVLANRDMRMFFNAPGSEPRYEVWGKLAYWTVDEATALSLGKDPQIVNERSMAPSKAKPGREFPPSAEFLDNSPFFHLYLQRRDMISRAHSYGVFGTHITPNSFLNWAQARHLSCPEQLLSVAGFESEPAVLSAEHEAALARISDLTGQLSEISAALVELRTSVDEIKPRRQVTLYKMILAMAVKHYQFGTRIGGRGTTSAIVSSADRVGYPVSTDAVHDVLESVRERLGFVQK